MKRSKISRVIGWFIGKAIKIITTGIRLIRWHPVAVIECHRCGVLHNQYRITWAHLWDWQLYNRWWVSLALIDGWVCDGQWTYCPNCGKIVLNFVYKAREDAMKEKSEPLEKARGE